MSAVALKEPLHLKTDDVLRETPVSDWSSWSSTVWVFENTTAGRHRSTARFDFRLELLGETNEYEAEYLTDDRFADLLDEVRRFVYSLLVDSRGLGGHLKPTGLGNLQSEVHAFLRWMVSCGFNRIADVPVQAVNTRFLERLVAEKVGDDDEDAITAKGLAKYLAVPIKLHQQSAAMPEGRRLLAAAPYDGKAAMKAASELSRKAVGSIPALPMAVFVPVMAEALSWVAVKAPDVLRMHDLYLREWNRLGGLGANRKQAVVGAALRSEAFSAIGDGQEPWRGPIEGVILDRHRDAGREGDSEVDTFHQLRRLVLDARDACVCLVQGLLGLRISEVAGLKAEPFDARTGLPACVEVEDTVNGVYEAFYVRGRVFKGEDTWQEVRWAAGLRPKGSDVVPPAVEALRVLYRLFKPYRDMADRDDLIVGFRNSKGLPKGKDSVADVMSAALRDGQRWWVSTYCDVPPDLRITTHMWRKTYAVQIYKADPALLPAISLHFKHLDMQTTYKSYIRGADPDLMEFVDEVSLGQTAELLMNIRHGRVRAAGRVYESLLDGAARFDGFFADGGGPEELEAIRQEIATAGVRSHECGWGRCLYRPEWARCGGGRLGPDEANRSPGTCSGCDNLLVLLEHRDFWNRRRDTNRRLVAEY